MTEYSYNKIVDIERMHTLNAKKIAEKVQEYSSNAYQIRIHFKRPQGVSYNESSLVLELISNCYEDKKVEIIAIGDSSQREKIKKAGRNIENIAIQNNKKKKIILKNFGERLITG